VLQLAASEVQPPNGDVDLHCGVLQVRFKHDELRWQVRSHAHDSPQLRSRHDPLPVQSTLHGPAPQLMFLQLCDPAQVMVHDLLLTQLMPLAHALATEQAMLQFQPAGHATCCLQPPLSAQSMTQLLVPVTQDVHCAGHATGWPSAVTPESTWRGGPTQNPSLQVRPSAQSACFSQAKSPLRWLTEQPPAVTAATPRTASQSTTSFTACLRS
jgi:hypothetical protein